MRAIAIIPARGGSKRIPRKNIKDFFGKPLIAYSIETALESELFEHVIVSTDDEEIANIAKEFGANVPFIRPKELSGDFTVTQDVIEHALRFLQDQGETYDCYCTIYATAPLLQSSYLIEGYQKLKESDAINVFSATSMPFPIQRTFKVNANGRCEMFTPEHFLTRSQDLEEAYQDAGQFYWTKLGEKSDDIMFGKDSIPIILPRHLVQDIDTLEDWERAEVLYSSLYPDTYDRWNSHKKKVQSKERKLHIKNSEIYFVSIGQNIGYESYGKDESFLRPVIVLKKLSKNTFVGIPLTSREKAGSYYFTFSYKNDKTSTAMLNQIRVFDTKRIVYKSGFMKKDTFSILQKKLSETLGITPRYIKNGGGITSKNRSSEVSSNYTKKETQCQ